MLKPLHFRTLGHRRGFLGELEKAAQRRGAYELGFKGSYKLTGREWGRAFQSRNSVGHEKVWTVMMSRSPLWLEPRE